MVGKGRGNYAEWTHASQEAIRHARLVTIPHASHIFFTDQLDTASQALLEFLATHPGRVFSRAMIIEHVWDQSFDGITNIVDVYVRHLRAKVDDGHDVKLIRTVRGAGYMIRAGGEL